MGGGKVMYLCSMAERCGNHACEHRSAHIRGRECEGECARDTQAECKPVMVSSVDGWTEERKAKAKAYERAMAQALEDVATLRERVRELEAQVNSLQECKRLSTEAQGWKWEAQTNAARIDRLLLTLRQQGCRYTSECRRHKPIRGLDD